MKTVQQPQPPTAAERVAAIVATKIKLVEQDRALLAAQLKLEGAGAKPDDGADAEKLKNRAVQLMNGAAPAGAAARPAGGKLGEIRFERAALKQAIDGLDAEERRVGVLLAADVLAAHADELDAIVRETARVLVRLHRLNALRRGACADMRQEARGAIGPNRVPFEGFVLLGTGANDIFSGESARFLQAAITNGVITEKDLIDG